MNATETGLVIPIALNYNASSYTSLTLAITRPDGSTITRTGAAVVLGTAPLVTTDAGTLNANEYIKYTLQAGDIPVAGIYTARVTYDDATKHLLSDPVSFTVSA